VTFHPHRIQRPVRPHTLSSSEASFNSTIFPHFFRPLADKNILCEIFSVALERGKVQMWKYEDPTHTESEPKRGGRGRVWGELQLFHFVPFILMIFYVMSCHTYVLSVFMAVRCSNASPTYIRADQHGARYKIISTRPCVWVALISLHASIVLSSTDQFIESPIRPWIHTNMKIV